MIRKLLTGLFMVGLYYNAFSTNVNFEIHINKGVFITSDSLNMPYWAYNNSPLFSSTNTKLIASQGDSLRVTIINNDDSLHNFTETFSATSINIKSKDTAYIKIKLFEEGDFLFYDNMGQYKFMGLSGMLIVKNPSNNIAHFYWNLKEHQLSYNVDYALGNTIDWTQYYPNYFTINGKSNPHINSDSFARVTGNVGDTIHIHITNTGRSIHSLHFHGYHVNILHSSKEPSHVGRKKDTFPIYSMETLTLELIPHQPGEYPVHDHNLVAVSGGQIYPNGMFTTLLIK